MRREVSKHKFGHAGLALPEKFTRPAQFQIFFGNDKTVICVAHDAKPFCRGFA